MSVVVVVIGEGQLTDMVCSQLSGGYEVLRQTDFHTALPESAKLVVVLQDEWHSSFNRKAEEMMQATEIPWLCGYVSYGEGVIGPLVRPGTTGCSQCAETRRLMASRDRQEMVDMLINLITSGKQPVSTAVSRIGLWQVVHLLVDEIQRVLHGFQARTQGRVCLIDLKTLKSSVHFFLPDPLCEVCGHLPDDSEAAAIITLKPNPKITADSYRSRSLDGLKDVLITDYLDARTGLFNGKIHDLVSPFANISVNLPLGTNDEPAAGRSYSYTESELTAILEGLERNCGVGPRGKRTVIYDSYRNLAAHALHPVTVGVYTDEQYAQPDFPFQPFDPDTSMGWVWGYSFLQERPILIPEMLAYYSLNYGDGFVNETSNGCALGGSLEEAVIHGILEVVERDAFLMTWYAQLAVPRLDSDSADDLEVRLMIKYLRAVAGYDVQLFNTTMEHGVPSIWALANNRKQQGVNLICAAGAHLDPIRAVKSAIYELAGTIARVEDKFESYRESVEQMLVDSSQVQRMEDHAKLYSLPQAEERLLFLLDEQRPLRSFDEEFKGKTMRHADLTDDLTDMLGKFRRLKLDVIVVDQTSPETLRNGLYCVKVLIPGMLPITFGHHLTRLTGLDRVFEVPMKLGYVKQPLKLEELNPHPHPFP